MSTAHCLASDTARGNSRALLSSTTTSLASGSAPPKSNHTTRLAVHALLLVIVLSLLLVTHCSGLRRDKASMAPTIARSSASRCTGTTSTATALALLLLMASSSSSSFSVSSRVRLGDWWTTCECVSHWLGSSSMRSAASAVSYATKRFLARTHTQTVSAGNKRGFGCYCNPSNELSLARRVAYSYITCALLR